MNNIAGVLALALWNNWEILASVTPKNGEYNSAAIAVRTFKLADEANERTRLVFPQPGGP